MPKINEKEFIDEIIFCIHQSDIIKAKALVQFFGEVNPKTQNRVLYELSKSKDEIAYPVLDYLCEIKNREEQINKKIYDLLLEISYGNPKLVIEYINREQKNRIIYIKIAGDLKIREALPTLSKILKTTQEKQIKEEAIKSIGAIGGEESVSMLLPFLQSNDDVLKITSISALSEIGTPDAIEQLTQAITGDSRFDHYIIKGLTGIQNRLSIEKLSEMLGSSHTDIRTMALESLTKIGPKSILNLVENLKTDNPDKQIQTLTILGKIGDPSVAPAIQKLLIKNPENSNVRFGAYEALGRLSSSKTALSLTNGLEDPDEQVRLAAAKAIDKNINNVLIAGLKNLIKAGDDESKKIVATFIDSEADAVFDTLIEWDIFPELASEYLLTGAHPDTRDHFVNLLKKKGKNKLVQKIKQEAPSEKKGEKQLIYAVDDSTMMLKLYKKLLHAMDYNPVLFQFPVEVIKAVHKKKPDLVLTDLNMPGINGLELVKKIRTKYSIKELPIIMITTQSDFIGGTRKEKTTRIDDDAIKKLDVNKILHKPFTEKNLKSAISEVIGKKNEDKKNHPAL